MFIIYSSDYFLLTKQLNKLIKTLQAKTEDLSVNYYSWLEDPLNDMIQDGTTYDLFRSNKLLVIKDCYFLTNKNESGVNDNELAPKLLEFNQENTQVVFLVNEDALSKKTKVAKLFQDKCEVITPSEINEAMIKRFIAKKLELANKTIDDDTLDQLTAMLPMDMTIVNSELSKLLALSTNEITSEIITNNISKYSESNVFELSDYFTQNKTKEFIEELHNYYDANNDLLGLLFLLGNSLGVTRDVFILHNQGKNQKFISDKLSVHPYRVKMILQNNHNIDIDHLNDKILLLYNLYNRLMDGSLPNDIIPELELVKIIERDN